MGTPRPTALPKCEALWTEVWSLLDKGAIEELLPGEGVRSTPITFLQPKKKGGFRLILNLKVLNACLLMEKFREKFFKTFVQTRECCLWT